MSKFIEVTNASIKKKILLNTKYIFSIEQYGGAKFKGVANAVIKMSYNESDIDDKSWQWKASFIASVIAIAVSLLAILIK